ncbi:MAG: IS6 family transposase, partial [Heliomarina sp.]|uniref:IS6 family transposase n=1 Tax=Heliomarina sp. TaxID=2917556 RepID=UPI00405A40D2
CPCRTLTCRSFDTISSGFSRFPAIADPPICGTNLSQLVDHFQGATPDDEGELLESFVTKTRDRKAALKFIRKSMKRYGLPEVIVTDRLRSYGAALKEIGAADRLDTGRWMNNRADSSYLPFRRRERVMLRFRHIRSLQKFASVHASVDNHFNPERHLYPRQNFKLNCAAALAEWRGLCAV